MLTKHSLNLKQIDSPCFAFIGKTGGCRVMATTSEDCGTYKCPFYKPKDCRDWVRIDGGDGANIIPPEDL